MSILQFPGGTIPPAPDGGGITVDGESDHRIANNLALIVGLIRLRARTVGADSGTMDRGEVRVLLEDIAARVETVARLHRMLAQSHRHAIVDLCGYLRELCMSLTGALSPEARVHVSQHGGEEVCALPPGQLLALGLLTSELVSNSVKHAHPTGLPVQIQIGCLHSAEGNLIIEIADDGIGLPENFDTGNDGGLGFRIVRSLASQLGASIRFSSSELGTSVRLEIPAAGAYSE